LQLVVVIRVVGCHAKVPVGECAAVFLVRIGTEREHALVLQHARRPNWMIGLKDLGRVNVAAEGARRGAVSRYGFGPGGRGGKHGISVSTVHELLVHVVRHVGRCSAEALRSLVAHIHMPEV
jgi:hypothetical protein